MIITFLIPINLIFFPYIGSLVVYRGSAVVFRLIRFIIGPNKNVTVSVIDEMCFYVEGTGAIYI